MKKQLHTLILRFGIIFLVVLVLLSVACMPAQPVPSPVNIEPAHLPVQDDGEEAAVEDSSGNEEEPSSSDANENPVAEEADAVEEEESKAEAEVANESEVNKGIECISATDLPPLTQADIEKKQYAKNTNFLGRTITGTLDSIDLSDTNFSCASFSNITLTNVTFENANLTSATFTNTQMISVTLVSATLTDASLVGATLTNHDFSEVNLNGVDFSYSNLNYANFGKAEISNSKFISATLKKANFTEAKLNQVRFTNADMTGSNFTGLTLGCLEGFESKEKDNINSVAVEGEDSSEGKASAGGEESADDKSSKKLGSRCPDGEFSTDFSYATLTDAVFYYANAQNADFSRAIMHNTKFNIPGYAVTSRGSHLETLPNEANIRGSNFRWADLTGACLSGADLSGADLRQSLLGHVELDGTKLLGADLSQAYVSPFAIETAICSDQTTLPFNFDAIAAYTCIQNNQPVSQGAGAEAEQQND